MGMSSLTSLPTRGFAGKYPAHIKITMPSLSPTMDKGNLSKWHKKEGDEVAPGDILAEIETDKATMDFEMQEDGYIAKLLVEEGAQGIALGEMVAILVEDKENIGAFKDFSAKDLSDDSPKSAPEEEKEKAIEKKGEKSTTDNHPAISSSKETSTTDSGNRTFASPYARKIANEKGINLNEIEGTGPKGRIIAADVNGHSGSSSSKKQKNIQQAPTTSNYEDLPVSQIRKIIAQRLTESKDTIPHYYVTIECEVDKLLALRTKLNLHSEAKISVNDMIIKAASLAALKVPATNSSWQGDFIRAFRNVDMSVAVSTPKGLITPIIKNANVKGLQTIASEMKDLATRARANKLKPEEFQGGTFSISNMGMFGVSHFSAIINPPQACILAVGAAQKRVLPNEGALESGSEFRVANVLAVTLSSDHRVVDGADAATWGQHFRKYVENPENMML